MWLTASFLEKVLSDLKSDLDVSMREHARVFPRVGVSALARVFRFPAVAGDVGAVIHIREISQGGLAFLRAGDMDPGTPFLLALPGMRQDRAEVLCEVIHSRQVSPDLFVLGAHYSRVVTGSIPALAKFHARA